MAGGAFANEVPCMVCMGDGMLTKATRVYEGVEDDHYVCETGHRFGMDFRRGPAEEPQWPPEQELIDALKNQ